ncbi:hypothetical protein SLS62_003106 [Diatrype stigma]|uniref:Triosephosphate isomerase n=1 Tax=Diatrype stigma TaxID=117547 RepID=A0AAN9UX38_9PEZI
MSSSPTPPSRRRLVGVSTKMYFSFAQTQAYIASVLEHLSRSQDSPPLLDLSQIDIFIVPDHISLVSAIAQLKSRHATPMIPKILPGAQDAFHEDCGAYTGFTSPAVLAEVGCRIVELGHAERRRLLGETDADVARRAAAVVRNGMVPLVCIGERTRGTGRRKSQTSVGAGVDREGSDVEGEAEMIAAAVAECKPQVEAVLAAIADMELNGNNNEDADADVILAYEPVWAIGAPAPAPASHVVGVARGIRELECVRRRGATRTRIVYGGSAGPGLFAKLLNEEGGKYEDKDNGGPGGGSIDGLFLGRFAHDPAQFVRTIREVAEA